MPVLPTHKQQNGQVMPNIRDIGRGPSYIEQQRELKNQKRKRGRFGWHLSPPHHTNDLGLALKNHFVAMVGEFVGTCLFMIFALGGTNVANIPSTSVTGDTTAGQDGTAAATANTSNLLYISLSFGFSLAVNAWIFFRQVKGIMRRVSGGLFNPAVSLGMMLVGALTPLRAGLLTISQILGGIVGAAIIQAITPGTLNVRTTLGGGTSVAQGLFIEMFLTSMLMITILLLAAEKHKATFLAPIGIGLALFIAELLGVYYTGGSLNPARSFGPAVVLRTFSNYHWIYWLGPAMGATLAAGFYKFIKFLEYETVLGPEEEHETTPGAAATSANGVSTQLTPSQTEAGGFALQGAGLGDLLTHGPKQAVFDLPEGSWQANVERLDRIEQMLHQLVTSHGGSAPRSPTSSHAQNRNSMATIVGDDHHMNIKSKDHIGSGSGSDGAYAFGDVDRHGNVTQATGARTGAEI